MLRSALLWLSGRRKVFDFLKSNGTARALARRFVAGETLGDAIAAVRRINGAGMPVTLDHLGEGVSDAQQAAAATHDIIQILDRIAAERVNATVSLKLTQLGLDIDAGLCRENMLAILECAQRHDIFVRIDMEASSYTERTLDLFRDHLHPRFGDLVGVVIQSALRRSGADVESLIGIRARVRLVKGAYAEPSSVAFPRKRDVDAAFVRLASRLLEAGSYPAIATHDGRIVHHVREFVQDHRLASDRFEFQMLYGVRRDLQAQLSRAGFRVRVYVPFGTEWYPYLMRRLAERPANVAFMTGSIVREALAGR